MRQPQAIGLDAELGVEVQHMMRGCPAQHAETVQFRGGVIGNTQRCLARRKGGGPHRVQIVRPVPAGETTRPLPDHEAHRHRRIPLSATRWMKLEIHEKDAVREIKSGH